MEPKRYDQDYINGKINIVLKNKKDLNEFGEGHENTLSEIVYFYEKKHLFMGNLIPFDLYGRSKQTSEEGLRLRELLAKEISSKMGKPYEYFTSNGNLFRAIRDGNLSIDDLEIYEKVRSEILSEGDLRNQYLNRGKEVHSVHEDFVEFLKSVR